MLDATVAAVAKAMMRVRLAAVAVVDRRGATAEVDRLAAPAP